MRHRFIHSLALLILLTQAGLGSVSGVSVICFSQGSCGHSGTATHAKSCAGAPCCTVEASGDGAPQAVRITVPCEDDCSHCVDIGLPDIDIAMGDRIGLVSNGSGVDDDAGVSFDLPRSQRIACMLPPATGPPPEFAACPHAMVIRSTRLLI